MSFEMGYLADVKGDMARLGYLKILTSIVSQLDSQTYPTGHHPELGC